MFSPELTVGDLLTASAVLLSAAGLLASLRKDRRLRRREFAKGVRDSAARTVARLDRWREIALQLFDNLHETATSIDSEFLKNRDVIATRDAFWLSAIKAQNTTIGLIRSEEIELSYCELYGYDPRIYDLFCGATEGLRRIQKIIFLDLLSRTQADIAWAEDAVRSAELGNRIRSSLAHCRETMDTAMGQTLESFRFGMLRLVQASDHDVFERRVTLPSPDRLAIPSQSELSLFGGWDGLPNLPENAEVCDYGPMNKVPNEATLRNEEHTWSLPVEVPRYDIGRLPANPPLEADG